jgi:nucleotide-binding universal stress UspA family protein
VSDLGSAGEVERILLAIDASPGSLAAMEAAVELAAEYDAELIGVYVEDVDLLRLARLPFASEVVGYSARLRTLGPDALARQLRAQAAQARRALAREATRFGIRWRFQVARGRIPLVILAEADEADLVIVGKSGWSGHDRLGSTSRMLVIEGARHTLVLHESSQLARPVMVAYDGRPISSKALDVAADFARGQFRGLSVLLLAADGESAEKLQRQAASELAAHGLRASYRWLESADAQALAAAVEAAGCLLVLPEDTAVLSGDPLIDFLDRLHCPVYLVRTST